MNIHTDVYVIRVSLDQRVLQEKLAQLVLKVLQENLAQKDLGVFPALW